MNKSIINNDDDDDDDDDGDGDGGGGGGNQFIGGAEQYFIDKKTGEIAMG